MRTVFLVPRRDDGGHRDRLWAYCRTRWERLFPDARVYEGHHNDGPFNRSAAINTASANADRDGRWDVGIVIDSDVLLSVSQVRAAIDRAAETGRVTWAHRRWRGVREDATERLTQRKSAPLPAELERDEMDLIVERTNPLSWSCCVAIPRAVWDDMGGFDERFKGWGFEDMAFMSVVCGLYGHERIEGDVIHLWHPRSDERITPGETRETATPEYVVNARLGRRYMVALRRDHGLHDRPGLPSTEDERERDIANLHRDDAKYGPVARRLGLPDWSDWWPTLEELRDGAKDHRLGPTATVSVIVRTGGVAEAWPERSAYLRRSLASMAEMVTGPVVQRVIYADWAPEFRRELEAIGAEHGFYVVGEGHHGFTDSTRRLWRYIENRARGAYVFLAEDDFTYERPVDLADMVETLARRPYLAQIALLRNPCYPRELERGGILGWPSESFRAIAGVLEHRNFWTMNPSVFRRSIAANGWPTGASSERLFGDALLRNPSIRFGFWGDGEAWISHIGDTRAVPSGAGY